RRVAERVRVGVCNLKLQAVAHALSEGGLQGVVESLARPFVEHDLVVPEKRTEQVIGCAIDDRELIGWQYLVDVTVTAQVNLVTAHVIQLEGGVVAGSVLEAITVLV